MTKKLTDQQHADAIRLAMQRAAEAVAAAYQAGLDVYVGTNGAWQYWYGSKECKPPEVKVTRTM